MYIKAELVCKKHRKKYFFDQRLPVYLILNESLIKLDTNVKFSIKNSATTFQIFNEIET